MDSQLPPLDDRAKPAREGANLPPHHGHGIGEPVLNYRSSFLHTLILVLVFGWLGAVLMILVLHGLPIHPKGLLFGLGAGAVAGVLLTALAVFAFPVRLGPRGVRSYNIWGNYKTVLWEDIDRVGNFYLVWLRYLVIRSRTGSTIYVPVFLSNKEDFRDCVQAWAGPDNPLTKANF